MVQLHLDSNLEDFLDWATSTSTDKANVLLDDNMETMGLIREHLNDPKETLVHLDIIEFLSSHREFLHAPQSDDEVKPCPRTWQMVSDIYKTYKDNTDTLPENIFVNCLKGCIGNKASYAFIDFIRTNKKPLIKPEEFFKGKEIKKEIVEGFKSDLAPRQMIMLKSCIRLVAELEGDKLTDAVMLRLVNILQLAPKDLMISMMSFNKNNFPELSDTMLDLEEYQMLFIETKRQINSIR